MELAASDLRSRESHQLMRGHAMGLASFANRNFGRMGFCQAEPITL
jgi:hypothetical protein